MIKKHEDKIIFAVICVICFLWILGISWGWW